MDVDSPPAAMGNADITEHGRLVYVLPGEAVPRRSINADPTAAPSTLHEAIWEHTLPVPRTSQDSLAPSLAGVRRQIATTDQSQRFMSLMEKEGPNASVDFIHDPLMLVEADSRLLSWLQSVHEPLSPNVHLVILRALAEIERVRDTDVFDYEDSRRGFFRSALPSLINYLLCQPDLFVAEVRDRARRSIFKDVDQAGTSIPDLAAVERRIREWIVKAVEEFKLEEAIHKSSMDNVSTSSGQPGGVKLRVSQAGVTILGLGAGRSESDVNNTRKSLIQVSPTLPPSLFPPPRRLPSSHPPRRLPSSHPPLSSLLGRQSFLSPHTQSLPRL